MFHWWLAERGCRGASQWTTDIPKSGAMLQAAKLDGDAEEVATLRQATAFSLWIGSKERLSTGCKLLGSEPDEPRAQAKRTRECNQPNYPTQSNNLFLVSRKGWNGPNKQSLPSFDDSFGIVLTQASLPPARCSSSSVVARWRGNPDPTPIKSPEHCVRGSRGWTLGGNCGLKCKLQMSQWATDILPMRLIVLPFVGWSEGYPFLTHSQSTGNLLDPLADVVRRLLYAAETPREVQCGRDSFCRIPPFVPFLQGSTNL